MIKTFCIENINCVILVWKLLWQQSRIKRFKYKLNKFYLLTILKYNVFYILNLFKMTTLSNVNNRVVRRWSKLWCFANPHPYNIPWIKTEYCWKLCLHKKIGKKVKIIHLILYMLKLCIWYFIYIYITNSRICTYSGTSLHQNEYSPKYKPNAVNFSAISSLIPRIWKRNVLSL